jgi:uncharacterized protein (TIGR03663 family)
VVGWLAVAFVVFATRWLNLDGAPLQPGEAAQAMTSWDMLHRVAFVFGASPFLTDANTLLFTLLGSGDALARGLPCLAGTFVALSPFFLRHRLGRIGALASAAVLAVSPTLILGSRTLDATMPTLALGLGILLAGLAYDASRRPAYLGVVAALGALALMTGPLVYDLLIVVGAFGLAQSTGRAGTLSLTPPDVVGFTPDAALLRSEPSRGWLEPARSAVRVALITFGVTAVLGWTGLLTNFDGLGAAVAVPLQAWAAGFNGTHLSTLGIFPAVLLGYEPLAVCAGVAGALVVRRPARLFEGFLVWWAVIGLAELLATNGAQPLGAALVVIPLGLLAGSAADRLARELAASAEERRRLVAFAPLALSLIATELIAAGYASLPDSGAAGSVPPMVALVPCAALVLFVIFFALYFDWRSAFISAAAIVAVALVGFGVHAAMLLNPGGALVPDGLFVTDATSPDVRTLAADVTVFLDQLHIARVIEGRPVTEEVQVAAPYADPLRWYLRDASSLTVVSSLDGAPAIAVLGADDKAPADAYVGETFQLAEQAGPPALDPASLWRWLIYRQPGAAGSTWVKVFVKTQLSASP